MELQKVLETRYSCRRYTDQVPAREQIEAVLEAGRLAPTGCNYQPQRIYVVTGEKLAKVDECMRYRFNAPVCFIIGYDVNEAAKHTNERFGGSEYSFGEHDFASVLVHMALKATDLGLATCWCGGFDDEHLHELFELPESVAVRAVLDFGYPAEEKGGPSHLHFKRKPLEETVIWL